MSSVETNDRILALRRDLAAQRRECLTLPPEKALERILEYSQPAALVHAFPEEDLHLLIREIGPDDALPLLALASQKQLEYMLDQEIWHRDRIDPASTTQWLERLLKAESSPRRMIHWLAEEKTDLIELFLFRSIDVRMREHDQDPSVFGPDFFSYDDVFFIRILEPPQDPERDAQTQISPPQETVKRLLDHLAENDYVRFQAILLEATHVLPAETEEELYRLRTARLAEKGFLPFEEAVGLYHPLRQDSFSGRALRKKPLEPEHPDLYALIPMTVLTEDDLFTRALASIHSLEQRHALQEELAALCNRIIVADGRKINSRGDLAAVVAKASGYVRIALQHLQPECDSSGTAGIEAASRELRRYHLEGLFQRGFSETYKLKQIAEEWVHQSWYAEHGLPLTFWGETWLGVIGGLLIKRPLFFDNYNSGTMYREFADKEDIDWTDLQLEQITTVDRLLRRIDPPMAVATRHRFLSYKNLLLTLWARHRLALPEEVRPLSTEAFQPFFQELFFQEGASRSGRKGRIGNPLRREFLLWLADRTRQPADSLSETIGSHLEAIFAELEEHYGSVPAGSIDPRYIQHFLLKS